MAKASDRAPLRELISKYGTRVFLSLLLLLLFFLSFRISALPVAGGHAALSDATQYLLPAVTIASIVLTVFRRFTVAFSIFSGYHVGVALAILGDCPPSSFFFTVLLSILSLAIVGVWLTVLPILFAKWKREQDAND